MFFTIPDRVSTVGISSSFLSSDASKLNEVLYGVLWFLSIELLPMPIPSSSTADLKSALPRNSYENLECSVPSLGYSKVSVE